MLKTILLYYPSFENGGATKNLINIVNYFTKKKIKIILFSHKADKRKFSINNYLKIVETKPIKKLRYFPIRWNLAISSALSLYSKIKYYKKNSIIFSMQSHIPAIIVAKLNNKKISIRNSEEPLGATKYADKKLSAILVLILKVFFYNFSDQIIAISKKSEISIKKLVLFKNKVHMVFNPYLEKINKEKSRKKNKSFNILSIGRITKQKNLGILITSIINLTKKYKFIRLIIVGNGDQYNFIKNKYSNYKNIKLLKWKKNPKFVYLESDLFVLSSFYEGLPNTLLDAVNYNIPCIATDVSGVRDILLDGKGGVIIKNNNQNDLQKSIEFAIKNYSEMEIKAMIAKKKINRFTNANCVLIHKLFNKMINN